MTIAAPERTTGTRQYNAPRTEYVLRMRRGTDYESSTAAPDPNRGSWRRNANARVMQAARTYSPGPSGRGGIAGAFGNDQLIVGAWIGAMALVAIDEWHTYHILPRPSRLWWTTLVYGTLAVIGISETVLPLANALAIGYAIVLAYQYFNQEGQFSQSAKLI